MSKTTPQPSTAALIAEALRVRHEAREAAHSVEVRHVVALEQIADELTTIRVHLIGASIGQQGEGRV